MLGTEKPNKKKGFQIEEMEGEQLLFDPDKGAILYCNQTSVLIWQLCDGERTVDQIVQLLVESYPESAQEIEKDVQECLDTFAKVNAVELA